MEKFFELDYSRPEYKREKESLIKYHDEILTASSYKDIRKLWLSMKESMQHLEFKEEIAFIRFLCGISNEF
jgi:hypothetical protein